MRIRSLLKRGMAVLLVLILAVGSLSGCAKPKPSAITFFNYGENIDQETLKAFEVQTGIHVNVETFDDMENMYQKISKSSAPYDVVLVSDALMPRMISEKLIQPLDHKQVPNLSQMDDAYLNLSIDPGNVYSVPYMFGTVGIIYNKKRIQTPVDSWSALWEPAFKGRVFMFDTYRDTLGAAMKYLGYSLNTSNPDEIHAAEALLIKQRLLTRPIYGVDNGTMMIAEGESDINMIWSGEGLNLSDENPDLVYIVPKEGANFWIDSLAIPSKAPNKAAAEAFINFVSGKTCALRIADEIGYTTPNKEARAMQPEKVRNNPNAYMSEALMRRCEIYEDLSDAVKESYFKAWTEIKASQN